MKFGDLRGILQYVPQFRGRTFVIALDGDVVAAPNFSNILLDLAVLRSLSVRVVLVHGAAHQIRSLAGSRGQDVSNADGTGVTDQATLELSLDAITRLTNTIMQSLTVARIRSAMANAIIAHPAGVVNGVDLQFTGNIDRVDTAALESFLSQDMMPVVGPLGYDGSGRTLRVNSDTVAVELGLALEASKVIFVTLGEPDFGIARQSARQLSEEEARALLQDAKGKVSPGLESKLRHALRACRDGVPRVHLINGERDDALLAELFSNEGIGTMVFADAYQKVRAATPSDVDEMNLLIRRAVEDEQLVPRRKEEILSHIGDYAIMEIDGNIVGCVAVHLYPDDAVAELACLHIKRDHENQGYGRRLVTYAENRARKQGIQKMFAVSTQTASFFSHKGGYVLEDDPDILPKDRRRAYDASKRHGHILVKSLG